MNAVGQVGIVSGDYMLHLKRRVLLHSNKLLPERPSEAKSSKRSQKYEL